MRWQPLTHSSALRYSRFTHTGLGVRRAMASRKDSGKEQAKAAITTSPGSTDDSGSPHWRISTPSMNCLEAAGSRAGIRRRVLFRSSTHKRTAIPCSAASCRASRQHTPMSPKLSTTTQKRCQRDGAGTEGSGVCERTDKAGDKPGKEGEWIVHKALR